MLKTTSKQLQLHALKVVAGLLVEVSFSVDVLRDILDLPSALLHRCVQLHRVVSRVLQRLLKIRDLSRQFALGSYPWLK